MMRFVQKPEAEVPQALREMELGDTLTRLLASRGVETPEQARAFLSPSLTDLHDPFLMQDMARAVACVQQAIAEGQRIVVYGDYDVDGVAGTAILLTYLRKQGAKAEAYIPARHGEGYGLNIPAVERIAGQAQLLITVDCGITSAAEVARAQELGLRVVVTDHHQLGETPVACEAVLNPLLGGYPFPKLCGAGVALKLVQALGGLEAAEPLLDLAALATIADLVPLLGENRVLVAEGLVRLRAAERPGLRALLEVAGLKPETLTAGQVGYQLAPRINAGGRLADASRGVELLTTRDAQTAQRIAEALDAENKERQQLEQRMLEEAEALVRTEVDFLRDRAIVLCAQGWNPGVIGLVASRLVERYHWPVVMLAQEGDLCVGSARSIAGINIHAALWACRDLFLRFGGHAAAAGLTLQRAALPALRERLNAAIAAQAQPDTFLPTEHYDQELALGDVREALVAQLERLQPTGFGNPAPVFCLRGAAPVEARAVGKEGAHLKLYLAQDGEVREAIAFRMGARAAALPERVDVLFSPGINQWQDKRTVQCEVRAIEPYAASRAFLSACAGHEDGFLRAICAQILYNSAIPAAEAEPPARVRVLDTEALDAAIREQLALSAQGTVLAAGTLPGLRKWMVRLALMGAPLDYALGTPTDPRLFNAVCAAPSLAELSAAPRCIVLLDGVFAPGALQALAHRWPQTDILCAGDAQSLRAQTIAPHLPDDDTLRAVYRALRAGELAALSALAERANVGTGTARICLAVLAELNLIALEETPWAVRVLPPRKCDLRESTLLCALRAM